MKNFPSLPLLSSVLAGASIAIASSVFAIAPAQAVVLGFGCVSNNDVTDCTTGENQLFVDVTDAGSNQVLFNFSNVGANASSITQIYFDDNEASRNLFNIASLIPSVGVSFANHDGSSSDNNRNLPSGNTASPAFVATNPLKAFATSRGGLQGNGVNPGESLGIKLNLVSGKNYNDILAALTAGSLRAGVHVQGFTGGGSESFVNLPPQDGGGNVEVPEPATLAGLGLVTGLLAASRRRKLEERA